MLMTAGLPSVSCLLPCTAGIMGLAAATSASRQTADTEVALAPSALVPLAPSAEQPRLILPPPQDVRHAHLGWPKVVMAPNGTLILGCIAGPWHFGAGCPAVTVSRDKGETFSELRYLAEFDESTHYGHCGNIALGVAGDGSVILLAMAFTGSIRNTIYGWRSTDDGVSWQPVDTAQLADNRTGSVFGEVFPVEGLGLVVFGHYRVGAKPHTQGIWFAVSADNGQTWGDSRLVTESHLYEPALTFAQGRLVGLIRDDCGGHYRQLVSDDLGTSWAETVSLVGHGELGLPSPFIGSAPGAPETLFAFLTKRGAVGELGFIELWRADIKALDWHCVRKLISFPSLEGKMDTRPHAEFAKKPHALPEGCGHAKVDYGYPWMTPVASGEWFMVFYCGKLAGANGIYGMRITTDGSSER